MDLHRPRSSTRFRAGTPASLLVLLLVASLLLAACSGAAGSSSPANDAPADDAPVSTEVTESPTEAPAQEEPTAIPTEDAEAPTEASTEAPAEEQALAGRQTFQIDPEQSEARFIINEVLFGSPNEVIGSTTEVQGAIEIDLDEPAQTTISEIQINARSLATDNRFRNRSISRMILQSNRDEYQFITFTPTAIEGLPTQANVGDTLTLQVTGDLKIRDIIQTTTFEVAVTADSPTQVSGLAQTTVQRADFELTIPEVEGVADVTEEVRLELEFVALASE